MKTIMALTAVLLCTLATATAAAERSIEVMGEGSVALTPDLAHVQVGVVSEAVSASEALHANSAAMTELLKRLGERGIDNKDIQTRGFNVAPRYRHEPNREPELVGYQVSNDVQVRVRDLKTLGRLLDELVASGANRVRGIHFGIADMSEALDGARRNAVTDAAHKAKLYADATGLKLGAVIELEELGRDVPSPRPVPMSAARMEGSVPIAPGEVEAQVRVRVVYAAAIP